MELVAQGIANIASALFGGIPATGAIARTATNVKNGGRTPVAGITHAVTLLIITLFAGRWAALIPLAALAAILVVVAYHMSEWRVFVAEFRAPKSDIAVLLATFVLTVVVDLTVAIGVGMVLAAFLFMRRMAEVTNVTALTREIDDGRDTYDSDPTSAIRRTLPRGVQVYDINGPFFFGAAERFREAVGRVASRPKVLIIRLKNVSVIDSSGLHALTEIVHRSLKDGVHVMLTDLHAQPMVVLTNSGLLDEIGEQDVTRTLDEAIEEARELLGETERREQKAESRKQ
jgi:SulP family sulfate permease